VREITALPKTFGGKELLDFFSGRRVYQRRKKEIQQKGEEGA